MHVVRRQAARSPNALKGQVVLPSGSDAEAAGQMMRVADRHAIDQSSARLCSTSPLDKCTGWATAAASDIVLVPKVPSTLLRVRG